MFLSFCYSEAVLYLYFTVQWALHRSIGFRRNCELPRVDQFDAVAESLSNLIFHRLKLYENCKMPWILYFFGAADTTLRT